MQVIINVAPAQQPIIQPIQAQQSIPQPQLISASQPNPAAQQRASITNPTSAQILTATVLFAFPGTGPNEMPLKLGETIEIVKRGPPGGWSKGKSGAFPTDYVKFIEPVPATASSIPDLLNLPLNTNSGTYFNL